MATTDPVFVRFAVRMLSPQDVPLVGEAMVIEAKAYRGARGGILLFGPDFVSEGRRDDRDKRSV
ncbi:hypothetical protein OB919_16840 [Halobacteria archaeon AArc-curdl1]|uniref:Uncharacterized protein n=1 Tax=Natronosalvus hydrolyticus TaxID=2979988 RepID=A0AAP2ZAS8_9EURY|nr:hypothetical protein [Halobacteria archaeon AArc-curdl1]